MDASTAAKDARVATQHGPRDEHVDVFGLTDIGKVRKVNEDQFLIATIHKAMHLLNTSLPEPHPQDLMSQSRAYLLLVADGVGGSTAGEQASKTVLATITEYVTDTMRCYYRHDPKLLEEFLAELQDSVLRCHERVTAQAQKNVDYRGMATTLTMMAVVWPQAYTVQVGDSRAYQLRDGELTRLTKDQTVAQALIDEGVMGESTADGTPWRDVLSSAIGHDADPVTSVADLEVHDTLLLCTDGLTKHVSDDEISEGLSAAGSAEEQCRRLVDLALERGGSDNVTVVVAKLRERQDQ